jgi:hypothetical protein
MARSKKRSKSKSRSRSKSRSPTRKFVKELRSRVRRISRNLRNLSKRRRIVIRRRTPSPSPLRLRFYRTPVRIVYRTPLYRRRSPIHIHHHRSPAPAARVAAQIMQGNGLLRSPDPLDFSTPAIKIRARRAGLGNISDAEARAQRRT